MAEPQENTSDAESTAGAEEVDATPPPRGRRFFFLLIPVLLLTAAGGAWLGYAQYPALTAAARSVGLGLGTDSGPEKPIQYGHFIEIQGLIINPAGTDGKRYLMVNVGLESRSARGVEEVKDKEVVVRDAILKVLGQRTVEELADIDRRTEIKDELRTAVSAIMGKGTIERMYFTQYVLQ